MDRISGQLTLVAFNAPSGGNVTFVPAFPAIYGQFTTSAKNMVTRRKERKKSLLGAAK